MWWDIDGSGWWVAFGIGTACWLTTVGLIVWAIVRATGNREHDGRSGNNSVEIARQRLARGEITPEQFNDLKKALR